MFRGREIAPMSVIYLKIKITSGEIYGKIFRKNPQNLKLFFQKRKICSIEATESRKKESVLRSCWWPGENVFTGRVNDGQS